MSDLDLAAIKARVGAATRKGWVVEEIPETGECRITSPVGVTRDIKVVAPGGLTFNNADFIAHARTDVPALIAENVFLWGGLLYYQRHTRPVGFAGRATS